MTYQIETGVHAFAIERGDQETLLQLHYFYHPGEAASHDCPSTEPFVETWGKEWDALTPDERDSAVQEIMEGK